jgi:hypothetical protein
MFKLWFHGKKSMKMFLCPLLALIQPEVSVLEVSLVFTACPSGKSYTEMKTIMEHWWNTTEWGNLSQHSSSTTNLTWTSPSSNSGFCDERPI